MNEEADKIIQKLHSDVADHDRDLHSMLAMIQPIIDHNGSEHMLADVRLQLHEWMDRRVDMQIETCLKLADLRKKGMN